MLNVYLCHFQECKINAILNVGVIIGLDVLTTRDPTVAGRKTKKWDPSEQQVQRKSSQSA